MAVFDTLLGMTNVAFFYSILIWVLVDSLGGQSKGSYIVYSKQWPKLFTTITVLCNAVISLLNMAFVFYEYSTRRIVGYNSFSLALTWVMATVVSFYSMRAALRENNKRFPLVLMLWWFFATVTDIFSLSLELVRSDETVNFWIFFSEENIVAIVSLPMLLLLCCNVLYGREQKQSDVEQQLLQKEVESPREETEEEIFTEASSWSKLTFRWLNPIINRGRVQKLELGHIPSVPHSETAESATSMLQESLCTSLTKAIIYSVLKSLAFNAVLAGINTIASYIGPLLISSFVNLMKNSDRSSIQHGLVLASVFFLSKTVESLSQRQCVFGASRIAIRTRSALMALVYNKSLSIKCAGPTHGKIINLINEDAERIGDAFKRFHEILMFPFQVITALIILYINLGPAPSLAACVVTLLVMVCSTPLTTMQKSLQSKIMEAKDSRIKVTSETMKNMRILKMQAWECTFLQKLLQLRDKERSWLQKFLHTKSAIVSLFWAAPALVSIFSFGTCLIVKTELTTPRVLSALATFKILQDPIYKFPDLYSMITQALVSVKRVQEFIMEEDQNEFMNRHPPKTNSGLAIEINPSMYSWETNNQTNRKPTIQIVEKLIIQKGMKVAVCGSVGSGKSSLLSCMLGEIPLVSGEPTNIYGTTSYVAQSAWIQSGTIRDNILFGKEMNLHFYAKVLEGCALNQDLRMWSDQDMNLVEERGANLSGGQKQRVQLARAVYSNADICLLDDPFSAVDAHTRTHLFQRCLMDLLHEKTVVYATHQLEFLQAADLILVVEDGKIIESGAYNDLIGCPNSKLMQHMAAHEEAVNQINPFQEDDSADSRPGQKDQIEVVEENVPGTIMDRKRTKEEEAMTGRVKWSVYSTFVTSAYRGALVPIILLCHILFQVMQMGSSYWISWATEERGRVRDGHLMGIYILLSSSSSIFIMGRAILMSTVALETAERLFHGMLTTLFRAPVAFFDVTPSSRIISRASTDQSIVDIDLPFRLAGLVFALIQILSIIMLMSWAIWQCFLLFVVVLAISIWYQAYYITAARDLARMVGIKKAPILHHFSESIAGAATIRCFNQEQTFMTNNMALIDDYSRESFHNDAAMEWLSVRINFLFNLVFYFVLVILVTLPKSAIGPSLAGLVASYGLTLNELQAWVIMNLCGVENKIISVERILQFSSIPSEAPLIIQDCRPEPEWPRDGKIEFHKLNVQYDLAAPIVLKDVTCIFPGQKKIGIVGRTGSGKSTLLQALFRIVEPLSGCILIDGVDISKIGLRDLRTKIGIIPQDPTLFLGTVRTNLDPLEQHTDQELWEVLRKCHLAEIVRQDPRLLDAPVAENGENWSVGQRQLVCLVRLLLKKRKILVLDEATASIDTATDSLIQKTIRKETEGCTVITVAHRIPTVIDNDFVLVLDQGRIVEYGQPNQLLQNRSSAFSKLVSEFSTASQKK